MPSHRVYHWKHGWIPLDHAAELSKAGKAPALHPVSQKSLPRMPHITAGYSAKSNTFVLHDKQTGRTADLPATKPLGPGKLIASVGSDGVHDTAGGYLGPVRPPGTRGLTPAQVRAIVAKAESKYAGPPGAPDSSDPNFGVPFNQRLGNCYHFAAQYAVDNRGSTLVHGSIEGGGNPRLDHAWVVRSDGSVFEPTTGHLMTAAEFEAFAHPQMGQSYSTTELNKHLIASKHWGPWTTKPESKYTDGPSLAAHLGPDGYLTPERQALHDKIVADALKGVKPQANPTLHVLGGGPAAGKSSLIAVSPDLPKENSTEAVTVNADIIKGLLPEYNAAVAAGDTTASTQVHEESSMLAARILRESLAAKLPTVLDGTGDTSVAKMQGIIDTAHKAGFTVKGVYATIPIDLAIQRAHERGLETGRHVPPAVIRETHVGVSALFEQVAPLFDEVHLFDTTHSFTTGPKPLFHIVNHHRVIDDPVGYRAFLKKAHDKAVAK